MNVAGTTSIDTTTPVVLFGANNYCALGIVRSLGRLGVDVICVDPTPNALATRSRYSRGQHISAFDVGAPERSVAILLDVARQLGGRPILVSTFDERALVVDTMRSALAEAYLIPTPRPGSVPLLYNKESLYDICLRHGIPAPASGFPHSLQQAMSMVNRLRFPLMLKGIDPERLMRHTHGRRLALVRDRRELELRYREFEEPGIQNLALQELIEGSTSDSWFLAAYFDRESNCRFAITGQKLRQLPIEGGVTSLGETRRCDAIVESMSRLVKATGYHGIVGADFRYDARDGEYKLHDVNPRLGANFRVFVDRSGLDVVRAMYLEMTGQSIPDTQPHWARRWMSEELDFWSVREQQRSGTAQMTDWLRALGDVDEYAHWDRDDLRPSIWFAATFVGSVVRGAVRRRVHGALTERGS